MGYKVGVACEFDSRAVRVAEVEVRVALPCERRRWDALMREHHYLGFRQFAGRGLRHVAVWRGHWLALVGWQSGAFKCAPRDRWLGWHRSVQFRRLHLIGNNTRFLVLPEASGIVNLASRALSHSVRRLRADWTARYGHPLEIAETFVDPALFRGTVYRAANWVRVGCTRGFARHNGSYTDPHGSPKEMFVRALRRDARRRLADPVDRPEWACRATPVRYAPTELRSLRDGFAALPDSRRGQGRKHRLETVLSICALAQLAGLAGPVATAQFADGLGQRELRALGAWCSAERRWTAPSAATICRVAYEVMPGNTADDTTLAAFLEKIERQYGRSDRIWIMDRGIPTEETLASMREGDAPARYLVGTPKGRLTRLEKAFLGLPWQEARQSVNVKLLVEDGELYVLVHSEGRQLKERGMRRRRLKKLWRRLAELQRQSNSRDQLTLKLGAAKKEAGRAWSLVDIRVPGSDKELAADGFSFRLRRDRLRRVRRREGRYLLRSNMVAEDPATLWRLYVQLTEIEQAFKDLKNDLAIRPIFHQREERIEAHIFVSFIAYCLLVTLKNLARPRANGHTPRAIIEALAAIQMVGVHLPTADGRRLVLPRHTQPNKEHELLLHQLGMTLPQQPAPRISA